MGELSAIEGLEGTREDIAPMKGELREEVREDAVGRLNVVLIGEIGEMQSASALACCEFRGEGGAERISIEAVSAALRWSAR